MVAQAVLVAAARVLLQVAVLVALEFFTFFTRRSL
jgi:hypothetical protein